MALNWTTNEQTNATVKKEDLFIRPNHHTPGVFLKTHGELSIQGISITSNCFGFYSPILKWLSDFVNHLPQKVTLNLDFEYLDTASRLCMRDIVSTVAAYRQNGADVTVNWVCTEDDDSNRLQGEHLEYYAGIKFNFINK